MLRRTTSTLRVSENRALYSDLEELTEILRARITQLTEELRLARAEELYWRARCAEIQARRPDRPTVWWWEREDLTWR